MAEIDDATIARLLELCELARAEDATYGWGYDEAYLLEIGELAVAALPALLAELDETRREVVRLREGLVDALDGWREGAAYKGDYLREKHGDLEAIAALEERYKLRPDTP